MRSKRIMLVAVLALTMSACDAREWWNIATGNVQEQPVRAGLMAVHDGLMAVRNEVIIPMCSVPERVPCNVRCPVSALDVSNLGALDVRQGRCLKDCADEEEACEQWINVTDPAVRAAYMTAAEALLTYEAFDCDTNAGGCASAEERAAVLTLNVIDVLDGALASATAIDPDVQRDNIYRRIRFVLREYKARLEVRFGIQPAV